MKRFLFRLTSTLFLYWLIPGLAIAQDNKFSINAILNPPAIQKGTDISIYYLGAIFGVVDGVLHGNGTQIMGQMFGILNTAALVLGGIIIIFTLMISILNTANEGEVLGRKWSSVWIPLRSVLGIALLLPKATGYSIIQIFMMWVIVQGVAVGDSIWNSVLDYVGSGGVIIASNPVTTLQNQDAAKRIFNADVCMYAVQTALQKKYDENLKAPRRLQNIPAPPSFINTVTPIPTDATSRSFPGKNTIMPKYYQDLASICEIISWPKKGKEQNADIIYQYKITGIQQMIMDMASPAQQYANNRMNIEDKPILKDLQYFPNCDTVKKEKSTQKNTQPRPYLCKIFYNAALTYRSIMKHTKQITDGSGEGHEFIAGAKARGWLLAGMYFMNLNNVNQSYQDKTLKALNDESTKSPIEKAAGMKSCDSSLRFVNVLGRYGINQSEACKIVALYKNAAKFASTANVSTPYRAKGFWAGGGAPEGGGGMPEEGGVVVAFLGGFAAVLTVASIVIGVALGPIGAIVPAMIVPYGLVLAAFIPLYLGANPILWLAIIGNILVTGAGAVWVVGAITAAAAAGTAGLVFPGLATAVVVLVNMLGPMLNILIVAQFITGMTLMFYLPLIPFLIFTFAAIGWIILVIEAMVAAPIIALGITHPEGHEIVGKADPAILLLVNVFLRPGLMIIGFVTGIMLSWVGIWIFNQGFFLAFVNILPQTMPIGALFGIPVFLIIYTFAAIAIFNQAFTLIHVLPDKVLRWIGGSAEASGAEATRGLGEVKSGFESGSKSMGEGIGASTKASGERVDEARKAAEAAGETPPGGGNGSSSMETNTPQVGDIGSVETK